MSFGEEHYTARSIARNDMIAAGSKLLSAAYEDIDDDVDVCASFQKDLSDLRKQIATIQDKYNLLEGGTDMEVYIVVVMAGKDSPESLEVLSTLKAAQRRVCEKIIEQLSSYSLTYTKEVDWKFHAALAASIYLSWTVPGKTNDQDALDAQYQKVMNVYNDAPDSLVHTPPSLWIHKRTVKEA